MNDFYFVVPCRNIWLHFAELLKLGNEVVVKNIPCESCDHKEECDYYKA